MCINSDRYVAIRTCAGDASMQARLDDIMDEREDLNDTEYPSEEQFDEFGDIAIGVCAEFAAKAN